jgi:hypothetical protein
LNSRSKIFQIKQLTLSLYELPWPTQAYSRPKQIVRQGDDFFFGSPSRKSYSKGKKSFATLESWSRYRSPAVRPTATTNAQYIHNTQPIDSLTMPETRDKKKRRKLCIPPVCSATGNTSENPNMEAGAGEPITQETQITQTVRDRNEFSCFTRFMSFFNPLNVARMRERSDDDEYDDSEWESRASTLSRKRKPIRPPSSDDDRKPAAKTPGNGTDTAPIDLTGTSCNGTSGTVDSVKGQSTSCITPRPVDQMDLGALEVLARFPSLLAGGRFCKDLLGVRSVRKFQNAMGRGHPDAVTYAGFIWKRMGQPDLDINNLPPAIEEARKFHLLALGKVV